MKALFRLKALQKPMRCQHVEHAEISGRKESDKSFFALYEIGHTDGGCFQLIAIRASAC